MAKTELTLKRGDTFKVVCTFKEADGTIPDITTLGITTQIRDARGTLISEPTVTKLDQTDPLTRGKYMLRADTDLWPIQTLSWDIQYDRDGDVKSTDTLTIVVIAEVTRPA